MGFQRVFVSFSGRDARVGDFVRLLWMRLAAQPFEVFNYERPQSEIPSGHNIEESCKLELDRADFCIVVVSAEAFKSEYTKSEVQYARSLKRKNFLLPLVLVADRNWPEPYSFLSGTKRLYSGSKSSPIPFAEEAYTIVEKIVRQFCHQQGVDYFPAEFDLPRLPLQKQVWNEIYGKDNSTQHYRGNDVENILSYCNKFIELYRRQEFPKAQRRLHSIIDEMEGLGINQPYYPKIVDVIVSLQMEEKGINRKDELESLRSDVQALIIDESEYLDGNAFGLAGNIDLLLGYPERALEQFHQAESYIEVLDYALIHNKVMAAVLSGRSDILSEYMQELRPLVKRGSIVKEPGDLRRLHIIYAIGLCYQGEIDQAFDRLEEWGFYKEDCDVIRQFLDDLPEKAKQIGDKRSYQRAINFITSLELIAEHFSPCDWLSLVQRKAWLAVEINQMELVVRTVEIILSKSEFQHSVAVLANAGLLFHASGKDQQALDCCRRALSEADASIGQPCTSVQEFEYYRGLAAWMCGKEDLAIDGYLRAGGEQFTSHYYDQDYLWVKRQRLGRLVNW